MSTIGKKVQSMPAAAASNAAMRAVRIARSGSKLAASATGTGKIVRWPWMTSAAKISGTLRRESRITAACIRRAISAPLPLNTPVSLPATASATWPSKLGPFDGGLRPVATPPLHAAALSCS